MPYIPTTHDELYEQLRDRIIDRTEKLTNFEEGSLNHTLATGVAGYFEYFEHALLAVQLSAWIETAGGPIDEQDLRRLDIEPERIDLDLVNAYMEDQDLDELAIQNGVRRDPGARARGEVVFLVDNESVTVPAGTRVMTDSDSYAGRPREYRTLEDTSPESGSTGARVEVEAVDVGPEYNVGAGAITTMPSSPPGVRDVTNQTPITGGEPEETNAELRERAKAAVTQRSGGGTAAGITGGIVEMVDGVDEDNVYIEEHFNPPSGPPYVEVVVEGGEDSHVEDAIEQLHPTGIRHLLNRPERYHVDVTVVMSGGPINLDRVEGEIARYLSERGLGEDVNRAALVQAIMNADTDIENIETLNLRSDRTGAIGGDLALNADEMAVAGEIDVSSE